jgi:uncharacterized Tic20 family protein
MTEINENPQNPEIPSSEPRAEQPVNTGPAASAERPVNPEPAPNTGQPVNAEPAASAQPSVGSEPAQHTEQVVNSQPERVSKEVNKDARMWSMFCHLGGLAALLPILPIVGGILAPLIIWQIKKEEYPFVDEQGKEAVNFQISVLIYEVVAFLLTFMCVGALLLPAVIIFNIIFLVIAAVKANDGFHYRYPLCIRFIK